MIPHNPIRLNSTGNPRKLTDDLKDYGSILVDGVLYSMTNDTRLIVAGDIVVGQRASNESAWAFIVHDVDIVGGDTMVLDSTGKLSIPEKDCVKVTCY